MHFKKMEYYLKPYYKDYYTFKEHMEFSEDEELPEVKTTSSKSD